MCAQNEVLLGAFFFESVRNLIFISIQAKLFFGINEKYKIIYKRSRNRFKRFSVYSQSFLIKIYYIHIIRMDF